MNSDYKTYFAMGEKVHFRLRRLREIVRETKGHAQIERLFLDDREIEIVAKDGRLDVYSRRYSENNSKVIHYITKALRPEISPGDALERAREGILSRLVELEIESRERELEAQLTDYLIDYTPKADKVQWQHKTISKRTEKNPVEDKPVEERVAS